MMKDKSDGSASLTETATQQDYDTSVQKSQPAQNREVGGRQGPEPTRYGDWEKNGRCIDF